MNNNLPLTIVMPAHNAEQYVAIAIDSILSQTFSNFEFIIINDGSTDKTLSIIKKYKDPRIILINNKTNKGLAYSLNLGFKKAQGKYIARMDADDISMKNRLQIQVNYLDNHKKVGVCGSWAKIKNSQHIWKTPINDKDIKTYLIFNSPFIHPSIIFRKSILSKFNISYSNIYRVEDYLMWILLVQKTKFHNINKPLIEYYIHPINYLDKKQREQEEVRIRKKYLSTLNVNLNKQEFNSYNQLSNWLPVKNTKDLNKRCDTINILLAQLKNNKIISYSYLKRIMANRWYMGLKQLSSIDKIRSYCRYLKMTALMIANKFT